MYPKSEDSLPGALLCGGQASDQGKTQNCNLLTEERKVQGGSERTPLSGWTGVKDVRVELFADSQNTKTIGSSLHIDVSGRCTCLPKTSYEHFPVAWKQETSTGNQRQT